MRETFSAIFPMWHGSWQREGSRVRVAMTEISALSLISPFSSITEGVMMTVFLQFLLNYLVPGKKQNSARHKRNIKWELAITLPTIKMWTCTSIQWSQAGITFSFALSPKNTVFGWSLFRFCPPLLKELQSALL